MAYLLGVDTGGTYTDAVIIDDSQDRVIASAKALTTRPDLDRGIGAAVDAVLTQSGIPAASIGVVSLSTTLATNALVEGQGGRVCLIFIGFEESELSRDGLSEAMKGDPVIRIAGGHHHSGAEAAALDLTALHAALGQIGNDVTGFAVAAKFATRNAAHEIAVRTLLRDETGRPVTCSHELSSALGGPKRALTAVLNARLIGMIDRLIAGCEAHLTRRGIGARLMVVRGDGALVSAELAREKPIETILSGPAASIAGASWLTGERDALVSDIGGTTTDICLLRDGRPAIDPQGARVGPYRTMVEAVAMRTWGLGGDSEIHVQEGLGGGLRLGPKRLVPVSLAARDFPALVHAALDRALAGESSPEESVRFVLPLWQGTPPEGLDAREAAVAARLVNGPLRLNEAIRSRVENPALARLVSRGVVMVAGVTPSDAAHVLGRLSSWDREAAEKALEILSRRRSGSGERIGRDGRHLAQRIIDQLTDQTVECLLTAAFAEDDADWAEVGPTALATHPLTRAGLNNHRGVIETTLRLGVPVVGLGASAPSYYGAVGERLGARMVLPEHAGVANAIGAVVGQIAMRARGTVTAQGPGVFAAHLPDGPVRFPDKEAALAALESALTAEAQELARRAGVEDIRLTTDRRVKEVDIEGSPMFIEAEIEVTAMGRPRIAVG